ncbi:hypothetical protein I4U23_020205 [Adineta vaga]|nr:hypothetical protein I4U23_020205 [Adineta vaga]
MKTGSQADSLRETIKSPLFSIHSLRQDERSQFFVPPNCSNSSYIGVHCNISSDLCDMQKPCLNNGTCHKTKTSYTCSCPSSYGGKNCEIYDRSCKSTTCLNNGTCIGVSNTAFNCICTQSWKVCSDQLLNDDSYRYYIATILL